MRVVQDDHRAVVEGQPYQCVPQLSSGLRPSDNSGGVDGVRVVAPVALHPLDDIVGGEFPLPPETVHGEVVQDPVQPGGQARVLEGVGSFEGSHECVRDEVLGHSIITRQGPGVAQQARDLVCESGAELVAVHHLRR